MKLAIGPASEETIAELIGWRYGPPYELYDGDGVPPLNPERFFEARDGDGGLVGFYYFEPRRDALYCGLGLRPELTGHGVGLDFVRSGLDFAREHYSPVRFVLNVAAFNERALRVYERAGFRVTGRHVRRFDRFGDVEFVDMERPA